MNDPIHERGKAIEDLFFAEADKKLLEKMKREIEAQEARDALHWASGIGDESVLDALLAINIRPESLATVGLIPLVVIAWADNSMEDSEKQAILQAADISGIKSGKAAHDTLDKWLSQKPGPELLASWKAYIAAVKETLEPAALTQLKSSVLSRAESVAKSAGGFLGLGPKISEAEQKVLDDLAKAFG